MSRDFYSALAKNMKKKSLSSSDKLSPENQKLFDEINSNLGNVKSILKQVITLKRFNLLIRPLSNGNTVLHELLLRHDADFLLNYYDKVYAIAYQHRQKDIYSDASSTHLSKVVRSVDAQGRSPLMIACMQANEAAALRLIKYDLDCESINIRDKQEYTPLHIAYLFGMERVVDVLIRNGADITKMDHRGRKPEACLWLDFDSMHQAIREVLSWLSVVENQEQRVSLLYSNNLDMRVSILEAENKAMHNWCFMQESEDDKVGVDPVNACAIL